MIASVPRKRTVAAVLTCAAMAGLALGAVDRARGVPSSAERLFQNSSADRLSPLPAGDNGRRPGSLHSGAAANLGSAS